MILPVWETSGSDAEYRDLLRREYVRLKSKQEHKHEGDGLEEVKLRLFLSLLERPVTKADQRGGSGQCPMMPS